MFENVKRISIIGGPGTGKSTLADNLGRELKLPVYHMDGVNYFPNWVQRDKEDRDRIYIEQINKEQWVMEGTYRSTLEPRMERTEVTIYLDFPSIVRAKNVLSRYLKNKNKEKPEIPGCKEQMHLNFLWWVIKWRKKKPYIKEVLEKNKHMEVIIFKSRKKLNKWYEKEFAKKIKI